MRKLVCILLAVAIISCVCLAKNLNSNNIEVTLDSEGKAHVLEEYFYFLEPGEIDSFRADAQDNGIVLQEWRIYDQNVDHHIGESDEDIENLLISTTYSTYSAVLKMEYDTKEPVMDKITDSSRITEWSLIHNKLNLPVEGTQVIIPSHISIKFVLPQDSEVIGKVIPEATISGNKVEWKGFSAVNQFVLVYKTQKGIIENLYVSNLFPYLFYSEYNYVFLGLFVLVVGLAFWKRKRIAKRVEEFVVKNSEIKADHYED